MATALELRRSEFDARQRARELRLAVFEGGRVDEMARLVEAERELQRLSDARAAAEKEEGLDDGRIVSVAPAMNLMGPDTTGLDVKVDLRMSTIVTSIVHLFTAADNPLVTFEIRNTSDRARRLRLISYVEGYSARAVETVELPDVRPIACAQMPTFFRDALASLTEVNRASLNVEVQDLDAKTEVHRTIPVWLLARSTAPLQVKDPSTGKWQDMTPYLGAFVTPNAPAVMSYLRKALDKHPHKRLIGYQVGPDKAAAGETVDKDEVASEVKAVYEALAESGVTYVNSIIDFTPEAGTSNNQRVRVPREALADRSANCIDGAVLVASLLEGISLNPALVIVPGHAFVAWETWKNSDEWRYLETTMLATHTFDEACAQGDGIALKWQALDGGNKTMFKRWPLRELRARGITPLE